MRFSGDTIAVRRRFLAVCFALAGGALDANMRAARAEPTSAGPVDAALIEDLVAATHILARKGVVDGYGHVSARHPRSAEQAKTSLK